MLGIAASDLHLGYRAFARKTHGRNSREIDVERAWSRAVDRIIEARPDLVTIAGDCLDKVHPGMHAVVAFQDGIRRIVRETDAVVVVIQGNHEAARTAEALTPIAVVDGEQRVHVVTDPFRVLRFTIARTGEACTVTCLPFNTLSQEETHALEADAAADVNVLLIHAPVNTSVEGAERLPSFYAGLGTLDVGLLAAQFDVVAAGDYHAFHRLHPTALAFYSGSIERTSSNIWGEIDPKGVIRYDTSNGELELLEIETRAVHDYDLHDIISPGISSSADTVNRALKAVHDLPLVHTGTIVRLVVSEFPRGERSSLDWKLIRQLKEMCFHFQLDLHVAADEIEDLGDRRENAGRSVDVAAEVFFRGDPAAVRDCALSYLAADGAT